MPNIMILCIFPKNFATYKLLETDLAGLIKAAQSMLTTGTAEKYTAN